MAQLVGFVFFPPNLLDNQSFPPQKTAGLTPGGTLEAPHHFGAPQNPGLETAVRQGRVTGISGKLYGGPCPCDSSRPFFGWKGKDRVES